MDAIKRELIAYLMDRRNEAVLSDDNPQLAYELQLWINFIQRRASIRQLCEYYCELHASSQPTNQQLSLF